MMADCLYECLKEAHLEKYYAVFVQQGLRHCESLLGLSMQDYNRYGVVVMADRLRLFKLIQIIRTVQSEGIYCKHGVEDPKHGVMTQGTVHTVGGIQRNHSHDGHTNSGQLQQNGHAGLIADRQTQVITDSQRPVRVEFAPGPMTSQISQPQASQKAVPVAYRVENHKAPSKPVFREKPLFDMKSVKKSPEVVYKKGSDTPVFKCRKTLRFSDSDLESDEDNVAATSSNSGKHSRERVSQNFGSGADHTTYGQQQNYHVQTNSNFVHPQKSAPSSLANVRTDDNSAVVRQAHQPKAFFIESGALTNRDALLSSARNAGLASDNPPERFQPSQPQPVIKKKPPVERHAYFPSEESKDFDKPAYIEKVYHNGGYNYGIPQDKEDSLKSFHRSNLTNGSIPTQEKSASEEKIRVVVRKRPLTAREMKRKELDIIKVPNRKTLTVDESKLAVDLTRYIHQHVFCFDEVFGESCSNEDVYDNAVRPLVKCVFNGGSGTCFAFGQTGAGKTFTLLGSRSVPGMYYLAARDIFSNLDPGVRVWASYYEIYCGQLYDLLNKRRKLSVRENSKQKVCIAGLMETQVREVRQMVQVVQYGNSSRRTGSTGVNVHSSRSHAILQMELRDMTEKRLGRLSFIDLAGSERASDVTGFNRQTRMEGAEINQSLLALKECIRSIDQDSRHTPYRQSKLTHILRDSFLGNAHTVMIATVSPVLSACENTLNTLRYADRVKELKHTGLSSSIGSAKTTPANGGLNSGMTSKVTPKAGCDSAPTKTPKKTTPCLFHPSKIQFSSTPKVKDGHRPLLNGAGGDAKPVFNISEVLQDGSESPISGHRLNSFERDRKSNDVFEEVAAAIGEDGKNGSSGPQTIHKELNGSSLNKGRSSDGVPVAFTMEKVPSLESLPTSARSTHSSQAPSHSRSDSAVGRDTSGGSCRKSLRFETEDLHQDLLDSAQRTPRSISGNIIHGSVKQESNESRDKAMQASDNSYGSQKMANTSDANSVGRTTGNHGPSDLYQTSSSTSARSHQNLEISLRHSQQSDSELRETEVRSSHRSMSSDGSSSQSHRDSASQSQRSEDDIIREHNEIIHHLESVLGKAKAVIQRATPNSSFEKGHVELEDSPVHDNVYHRDAASSRGSSDSGIATRTDDVTSASSDVPESEHLVTKQKVLETVNRKLKEAITQCEDKLDTATESKPRYTQGNYAHGFSPAMEEQPEVTAGEKTLTSDSHAKEQRSTGANMTAGLRVDTGLSLEATAHVELSHSQTGNHGNSSAPEQQGEALSQKHDRKQWSEQQRYLEMLDKAVEGQTTYATLIQQGDVADAGHERLSHPNNDKKPTAFTEVLTESQKAQQHLAKNIEQNAQCEVHQTNNGAKKHTEQPLKQSDAFIGESSDSQERDHSTDQVCTSSAPFRPKQLQAVDKRAFSDMLGSLSNFRSDNPQAEQQHLLLKAQKRLFGDSDKLLNPTSFVASNRESSWGSVLKQTAGTESATSSERDQIDNNLKSTTKSETCVHEAPNRQQIFNRDKISEEHPHSQLPSSSVTSLPNDTSTAGAKLMQTRKANVAAALQKHILVSQSQRPHDNPANAKSKLVVHQNSAFTKVTVAAGNSGAGPHPNNQPSELNLLVQTLKKGPNAWPQGQGAVSQAQELKSKADRQEAGDGGTLFVPIQPQPATHVESKENKVPVPTSSHRNFIQKTHSPVSSKPMVNGADCSDKGHTSKHTHALAVHPPINGLIFPAGDVLHGVSEHVVPPGDLNGDKGSQMTVMTPESSERKQEKGAVEREVAVDHRVGQTGFTEDLQEDVFLAHEDHLAQVTMACKQEMKLLLAVKMEELSFDDYIHQLSDLLTIKLESLRRLQAQLAEYTGVAVSEQHH